MNFIFDELEKKFRETCIWFDIIIIYRIGNETKTNIIKIVCLKFNDLYKTIISKKILLFFNSLFTYITFFNIILTRIRAYIFFNLIHENQFNLYTYNLDYKLDIPDTLQFLYYSSGMWSGIIVK